jgi:1,4-dihydroxy-6-naphthoate synthase
MEAVNRTLTIGYSPCPNDTYIFYALIKGKVRVPGIEFHEQLEDVETLNSLALKGSLDITKISYHALGRLREEYALLRSGSALGRGCGPLIVARPGIRLADLSSGSVAIPGELTTAMLLMRLYDPSIKNILILSFERIMDAVAGGKATAGLIIHESRFTYPLYGLEKLLDLGEWWEQTFNMPIPLGGIIGLRSLGAIVLKQIETGIKESIRYAHAHAEEVLQYCKQHSQEMDEAVMKQHIDLYVNNYSLDLGDDGISAVLKLYSEAEKRGILPGSAMPLLAGE